MAARDAAWGFSKGEPIPGTDLVAVEPCSGCSAFKVRSSRVHRDFLARVFETDDATRWDREVAALEGLNHPNVIKLFQAVQLDSVNLLILEWIDAVTLAERVERHGPFAVDDGLGLFRQAVGAVAAVHDQGLVHRNLQPSAIRVDRLPVGDLFLKLVDFDLAKPPGRQSNSRGLFANATFAAPEQVREGDVSRATDVYQLGCLLFFLLTGDGPFTGTESARLNAHLFQPAPRISSLIPSLSRGPVDDTVLKMLEKSPDLRPSLATVIEALDDDGPRPNTTLANEPVASRDDRVIAFGPEPWTAIARGNHIRVEHGAQSSQFSVDATVSAMLCEAGTILFATSDGLLYELDVTTGAQRALPRLARPGEIRYVGRTGADIVAVNRDGRVFIVQPDQSYRPFSSTDRRDATLTTAAAAADHPAVALAFEDQSLHVHTGPDWQRSVELHLDFAPTELAVSPDGYVIAALGDDVLRVVSALDGSPIHHETSVTTQTITFANNRLVGLERSSASGTRRLTEIL